MAEDLNLLSNEELKELCDIEKSEQKYSELVDKSEEVIKLKNERDVLLALVKSLSEYNLGRKPSYEQERSSLNTLFIESKQLLESVDARAKSLKEISKKTSLETSLAAILAATTAAEEESDDIAKSFLDSGTDFDTFINQYLDKRKLVYLRRIKADKLRQYTSLRAQENATA